MTPLFFVSLVREPGFSRLGFALCVCPSTVPHLGTATAFLEFSLFLRVSQTCPPPYWVNFLLQVFLPQKYISVYLLDF